MLLRFNFRFIALAFCIFKIIFVKNFFNFSKLKTSSELFTFSKFFKLSKLFYILNLIILELENIFIFQYEFLHFS